MFQPGGHLCHDRSLGSSVECGAGRKRTRSFDRHHHRFVPRPGSSDSIRSGRGDHLPASPDTGRNGIPHVARLSGRGHQPVAPGRAGAALGDARQSGFLSSVPGRGEGKSRPTPKNPAGPRAGYRVGIAQRVAPTREGTIAYLGIDVGTGGTRALVMNGGGKVVASGSEEHEPFVSLGPGWAEQRPQDWWRACGSAVRKALNSSELRGDEITGVGFSGQMHGAVLLDSSDEVVRSAIIWCDQRSEAQSNEPSELFGRGHEVEIVAAEESHAYGAAI